MSRSLRRRVNTASPTYIKTAEAGVRKHNEHEKEYGETTNNPIIKTNSSEDAAERIKAEMNDETKDTEPMFKAAPVEKKRNSK